MTSAVTASPPATASSGAGQDARPADRTSAFAATLSTLLGTPTGRVAPPQPGAGDCSACAADTTAGDSATAERPDQDDARSAGNATTVPAEVPPMTGAIASLAAVTTPTATAAEAVDTAAQAAPAEPAAAAVATEVAGAPAPPAPDAAPPPDAVEHRTAGAPEPAGQAAAPSAASDDTTPAPPDRVSGPRGADDAATAREAPDAPEGRAIDTAVTPDGPPDAPGMPDGAPDSAPDAAVVPDAAVAPDVAVAPDTGEAPVTPTGPSRVTSTGTETTGTEATVVVDGGTPSVVTGASEASRAGGAGEGARAAAPVVSRIVQLVERLRTEPPPQQLVVDLEQFGVGRLVISLRGDTVLVGAIDRSARLDPQWWRDLGDALDQRGWSLDGRGEPSSRDQRQPPPQFAPIEPPIRPRRRVRADRGLRL